MNLPLRRRRGGIFWLVLVLSVLLAGACATGSDSTGASDDEFIGQPPSPEDDPFSVRGDVRGEAVEATPKGEISEEDFEEPNPREDLDANPDEWDEALGNSSGNKDTLDGESGEVVRCFSCVKICPLEGDCDASKRDLICGWGTHSERDQASRRARAECDATLDMARQMPVWSRIEGRCPTATCSR